MLLRTMWQLRSRPRLAPSGTDTVPDLPPHMTHQPVSIMVSSVVSGYEAHRATAEEVISGLGARPILVNEHFSALTSSPRNACLDAVAQCDALVLSVARRGGYITPSGMTATEEEFEEARRLGRKVLVFVEEGVKDPDAQRLEEKASDYVSGHFRASFADLAQLRAALTQALQHTLPTITRRTMDPSPMISQALHHERVCDEPYLRALFWPDRDYELFAPHRMEDPQFEYELITALQHPGVDGLDFKAATETIAGASSVEVRQSKRVGHFDNVDRRVQLHSNGKIIIELKIPEFAEDNSRFGNSFVLAEEQLELSALRAIRASLAALTLLDPFETSEYRWLSALHGLGHRTIERNPKSRTSHTMGTMGGEQPILAGNEARMITRSTMRSPEDEVRRALYAIRKGITQGSTS